MDVYREIRRLQLNGITSQRAAAKALGISRNTVKKYWAGDVVPWEKKPYERDATVLTSQIICFIRSCLEEDEREHVRKQCHTAHRIYTRLVEECGFTGSESSIRKAVHKIKTERGAIDVYIPLHFVPGSAMQVDWGEATIYHGSERMTVNLFCARLCSNCAPFVIAYHRQNLESFLDALTKAIQYFGGTPEKVIFDNARVAVKSGFGAHAAAQEAYAQLAAHYGFEPVFCNPASGNEKGLVENLVGYIRRNVCVPLPRVNTLDELNGKLLEQCVKYLDHRIAGKPATVGTMLREEQQALHPIPRYSPDISKKFYPTVGRYATVIVETNQYSVPCSYRGQNTTVKAYPDHIEIWINGKLAATHHRLYGRKEESLELTHYLPILAQKGRAIRFARPVQKLVPSTFVDWMENQKLTAKEMVEMLEACVKMGYRAVMQRGRNGTAPIGSASAAAATAATVHSQSNPDSFSADSILVQSVDLRQYDRLYAGEGVQ